METKKINKRGEMNLQTTFLVFIVIIGVFMGYFAFYAEEASNSGVGMSSYINNSFYNLTGQLDQINQSIGNVKDKALSLSESREGAAGFIVTSIEGFTATIKLMKDSLSFGFNTIAALIQAMTGIAIPSWVIVILFLWLTITIIFALLRAISGRAEI